MKKSILTGVGIVILAIGGGMAGNMVFGSEVGSISKSVTEIFEKEPVEEPMVFVNLEPFLLNLRKDTDNNLPYLKITLSIGMLGEENKALFESKLAVVRDKTLTYLRSKNDLTLTETVDGELLMKQELKEVLNNVFPEVENMVETIYITDMVMQ